MTEVIAHRGASGYAPENSLEAFDLALDQSADVLEFDVRISADDELVLVHDPTLLRLAGDPRRVDSVPAEELGAPSLEDVLSRYGRSTRYLIDLKDPAPEWEARVPEAIDRHGLRDRAVVQSFDNDALVRLRPAVPWLALAPLCPKLGEPAGLLELAARWGHGLGAWHMATDPSLVAAAHARGVALRVWTVDEPAEIERMIGLGADAIITNTPDIARAVERLPALAA